MNKKSIMYIGVSLLIILYLSVQLELISIPILEPQNDQTQGTSGVNEDSLDHAKDIINNEIDENSQDESFDKKDALILLIMDSTEHFQKVQGIVEQYNSLLDKTTIIQYAIDNDQKIGITTTNSENEASQKTYINVPRDQKISINEQEKTYMEFLVQKVSEEEQQAIKMLNGNERLVRGFRSNEGGMYVGFAYQIINSELVLYLKEYEDWNFEETEYLNFPAYQLTGTIGSTVSQNNAGPFEMIVHRDTGVVLVYKSFNDNGDILLSIDTKEILFDKDVDPSVFELDLSGYEKVN